MANEINVSAALTAAKGGATITSSGSLVATMAGDNVMTNVQAVGITAEAVNVGDVTTIGYVFMRNMDATNYVEIGLDSGATTQVFAKLMPGDIALFPAKTGTLYAKANTAPINLLVSIAEV